MRDWMLLWEREKEEREELIAFSAVRVDGTDTEGTEMMDDAARV